MKSMEEQISVLMLFDAQKRFVKPFKIKWRNRVYPIDEVASHFKQEVKGVLIHIFSVTSESTHFILHVNSETLFWTLNEVNDLEKAA